MTGLEGSGNLVLPVGTVAFLLTDVEASTKAWEREPDAMAAAIDRHNAILDAAISVHGGVCPPAQGEGDSIVAAFARASDAVLAARDAQAALTAEGWPTTVPLRCRMAVHAGEARLIDDGNYAGQAIIRTARLREVAHGGQVLVSAPARDLTVDHLGDRVQLRDLGEHRLRDLARPERIYQLQGPGLATTFDRITTLDARPHNLPIQLSTFIGRREEIDTVARLLAGHRLVTIAGAGGAGKTRLAQHVAAEVLDRFDDGVWWIELADVADPAVLAATISTVVGVRGEVDERAATALAERLGARRALLVLDNCEHLIGPVAMLVDEVLRRCPDIHVLATSREPLEVAGEVAWRIPPLGLPAPADRMPVGALPRYESVRLFVDRARNVRPNFRLDGVNGSAIASICTRLDGIPLAIELAAARCRSLSPEQILSGLTDAFGLLTGGGRTALPRQQTLEASIGWSHDLLTPDEQLLLRRLAVFSGGCTLDDAEAVLADDGLAGGLVLDVLDRLVAQSLVHLDDQGTVPRYRLLETVRQYAERRLTDAGEVDRFRALHADRFIELAERIAEHLDGADEWGAYARAVAERDNFALALETLASSGRWDDHARLTVGINWARATTDPLPNVRDLTTSLEHVPAGSARAAQLLAARAVGSAMFLDVAAVVADAAAAIPLATEHGDHRSAGRAEQSLGYMLTFADPVGSAQLLRSAADRCRRGGDRFGEVHALALEAACTSCIRGEQPAGLDKLGVVAEQAERLGSRYLTLFIGAAEAAALCIQGRFAEANARQDRLLPDLDALGAATNLSVPYLLRNAPAANLALYAQAHLESHGARPVDLDELPSIMQLGTIEEQRFITIAVGAMVAIGRASTGNRDEAAAELEAIAADARATGIATMAPIAGLPAVLLRDELGDSAAARRAFRAIEHEVEACGSLHALARAHCTASTLLLADGDVTGAERRAHHALALADENGFRWESSWALDLLAEVAAGTASPLEAVRLRAVVQRTCEEEGYGWRPGPTASAPSPAMAAAREAIGDELFEAAWAEGWAMALADAIAYAQRARGERKRPALGWDGLTPTEQLVVEQVALGLSNPEIAAALFMSRDTVKTHLSHVFAKLGVKNRSELAVASARRAEATD